MEGNVVTRQRNTLTLALLIACLAFTSPAVGYDLLIPNECEWVYTERSEPPPPAFSALCAIEHDPDPVLRYEEDEPRWSLLAMLASLVSRTLVVG